MTVAQADQIQTIMETQQTLNTAHETWVQTQVQLYEALRESNREVIKQFINWPVDRPYIVDPLPEKISEAFADLLFGEDAEFKSAQTVQLAEAAAKAVDEARRRKAALAQTAASPTPGAVAGAHGDGPSVSPPEPASAGPSEPPHPALKPLAEEEAMEGPDREPGPGLADTIATDQENLDNIIEANNLPSELRSAEMVCSSEGEVWWRIYVDVGQMDYPIIEWYSRSHVRPLFKGRKLIAAAFVSEIYREEFNSQWQVWRYLELQTEGYVRNLLYKGTPMALGTLQRLTDRPETADLMQEWDHQLGMLAGRIPNRLGRDRRYGVSDYLGIKDMLLSLNEATTIGHENARLVAKKRIAIPREALGEDGTFDAGEDVLVMDEALDDTLGSAKQTAGGRFAVLEYSFDANALIEYKTDLAGVALTRVGIAQQFVNVSSKSSGAEGMAASGTALRLRLIPTTLAAKGKARWWDDALPKILLLSQLVDSLDESQGGFGRSWSVAGEPPSVERNEPLPQDETEQINRHAVAVAAEIESRRTAIIDLHQDWSDDQVQTELDEILSEVGEFAPPSPPPFGGALSAAPGGPSGTGEGQNG